MCYIRRYLRAAQSGVRLLTFMKTPKLKYPLFIIAAYFVAIIICIALAFDFAGAINPFWTLVLIGLTLPWSLVSVLFAWALIHGAGLEFFTMLFLIFAGLNSTIFYLICVVIKGKSKQEA